jgi:hypothetical protein
MLSEDGATFVQISFWYYSDSPVITIYRAGNRHSLDGKAFAISPRKLEKTVSHRLWLTHHQKAYEFVGADKLRVITIDNREHIVDLRTGELSSGE